MINAVLRLTLYFSTNIIASVASSVAAERQGWPKPVYSSPLIVRRFCYKLKEKIYHFCRTVTLVTSLTTSIWVSNGVCYAQTMHNADTTINIGARSVQNFICLEEQIMEEFLPLATCL